MKKILFLLLFPLSAFGQKIVKDSIVTRNDSVFTLKYPTLSDLTKDTYKSNQSFQRFGLNRK